MISVTVRYLSWISSKLNKSVEKLKFDNELSINEFVIELHSLYSEKGFLVEQDKYYISINGNQISDSKYVIKDGDEIILFPPLSGG